jgi:hypothetical protein
MIFPIWQERSSLQGIFDFSGMQAELESEGISSPFHDDVLFFWRSR